jgi:alanine dehydrogenase
MLLWVGFVIIGVQVSDLKMGIVGTYSKPDEYRLPIHPEHLRRVSESCRRRLVFEEGYGRHFGFDAEAMGAACGGTLPRRDLLAECDIICLAKPLEDDLRAMKPGAVLWGWPHCVQGSGVTQVAIERRLTLIAWEAMFNWGSSGEQTLHLFHRNNELAGYCGVLHALELRGLDGYYGPPQSAVVISFGSVSRGAVYALQGRGFTDLTVYTGRDAWNVHDRIPGVNFGTFEKDPSKPGGLIAFPAGRQEPVPFHEVLQDADVIVNGIFQDTSAPVFFVLPGEEGTIKTEALVVDVSCDEGMGFPFAVPTSFSDPIIRVRDFFYYAVDHTPSYLANAATWEISEVVTAFLERVLGGEVAWKKDDVLRHALEIQDGVILNEAILEFQGRSPCYPHEKILG